MLRPVSPKLKFKVLGDEKVNENGCPAPAYSLDISPIYGQQGGFLGRLRGLSITGLSAWYVRLQDVDLPIFPTHHATPQLRVFLHFYLL